MKTVIIDVDNNVVNVAVGEPTGEVPSGLRYVVVEDDVWVGAGLKIADDGTYYDPNPIQEIF